MALHIEPNFRKTHFPITSSNGLMTVGMRGVESVADVVFSALSSPVGYACVTLLGASIVTLLVVSGGPLLWGLAVVTTLAVIAYMVTVNPFFRSNNHIKVKEMDTPEVTRVKELFDESFKLCKTARTVVKNAQKALKRNKACPPNILVNLDNNIKNVPFGGYCIPTEGLISLLYPSDERELLMTVLFESINISRSFNNPHNLFKRANKEKYVDESTRKYKINEYAKKIEQWEEGSVRDILSVCRKIINEMGPEIFDDNLLKQRWRSAAFEYMKIRYQNLVDEVLSISNHQPSKILTPKETAAMRRRLTSARMHQLKEQYKNAKTLEELDEILNEIEPDANKRSEYLENLMMLRMEKNGHTEHFRNTFAKLLPTAPNSIPSQF